MLDLGCSPGSWLQYASRKVGNTGHVLGIDVQPVKILLPRNVKVIQTDIFEITNEELHIKAGKPDVILSDMAPKTSGIRLTDAHRSFALNKKSKFKGIRAYMHAKEMGEKICKTKDFKS